MNCLHFERPCTTGSSSDADLKRAGRAAEAQAQAQTPATAPAKLNAAALPSDGVTVSDRATRIAEVAGRVKGLPEVRQERVERLRTEIETGAYNPPASDIAAAIIKRGDW